MLGLFKRTKIEKWETELILNVITELPDEFSNLSNHINYGLFRGVLVDASDIPGYIAFTFRSEVQKKYDRENEQSYKLTNIMVRFFISLNLILVPVLCQSQNTWTVNTPIHTPAGTINNQETFLYTGDMSSPFFFKSKITKIKSYYDIALPGDSLVRAYTRVDIKTVPHSITVRIGRVSRRLTPPETQFIVKIGDNNQEYIGLPADSCWMFRMISGEINVYHFLPFNQWEFAVAIQKGQDAPIQKITPDLIKFLISDDQKAMQFFEDGKHETAIRVYNGEKPHFLDTLKYKEN